MDEDGTWIEPLQQRAPQPTTPSLIDWTSLAQQAASPWREQNTLLRQDLRQVQAQQQIQLKEEMLRLREENARLHQDLTDALQSSEQHLVASVRFEERHAHIERELQQATTRVAELRTEVERLHVDGIREV